MVQTKELKEIHELAKERFQEVVDFEGSERSLMLDDKEFSLGEDNAQWNGDDVSSRERSGRSFLTIMRSNQFTDHIKNNARKNKPSIKISPTDEGAQEDAAKRRQGLVRHIQYESKANQARQAGFDDSVDEGRGHWIVKTEYIEDTFNSKIVIEPIKDARSVYMDWRRQRPDYSDCEYGFILTHISRDEFADKYPKASIDAWSGEEKNYWYNADDVTVAEYYCIKYTTRNLIEVEENGQTRILFEDELEDIDPKSLNITQEREVEDPSWDWYKMSGLEILDSEKLPFKEIPIITSIGKEDTVEGDWVCKGLIRDIKAPLRLYNFVSSNEADIIAKAPRAPWVGAEGQFEGYEQDYENSNTSDIPFLQYKPVTLSNGTQAPPPQRAQYSIDLSNITQQKISIIEDIKAITGIYDASLGMRSNESSGVAIRAREQQGDTANYHYIDNFTMAIAHEGRVINSALNAVYDTHRTVTIREDNEEESLLEINGEGDIGLGEGNFNTVVSVGPSFNTQREEQAAGMMEMFTQVPLVQNVASDLVVRSQDWVGKDKLADRLEFATEQQFQGITTQTKPDGKNAEADLLKQKLNQAQQQINQIGQQAQQLQEALQKADADKQASEAMKAQNEQQKIQLDAQRVRLEEMKIQGELSLKGKEIESKAMISDLDSATQVQMNTDNNQVKMIEIQVNQNQSEKEIEADLSKAKEANLTALETSKQVPQIEPKKEEKIEKPKEVKQASQTINIDSGTGKRTSVITPNGKGGYNVESKESK